MYAVLAAWIVVLAGVLDRCLYVAGRILRRPRRKIRRALGYRKGDPFPPGARLDVHAMSGEVVVRTWDRAEMRVVASHGSRDRVEISTSATVARVRVKAYRGAPSAVDLEVEGRDLGRQLGRLLAQLPEKYRRPLLLKEVQGMTYAEIAELLGWPMGTVQIRIHRARLRLREEAAHLRSERKEDS